MNHQRYLAQLCSFAIMLCLSACNYNPMIRDNHTTGSPVATGIGAAAGAGTAALIGSGTPVPMTVAGIGGGAIGYYLSTLRFASGGVVQNGGTVYKIGDYVGIYIPTDNLFQPNTADFTPQAPAILDSAVDVLNRYPNNNVLISGNTSGFDRPRRERALSLKRARMVSAYLWKSGVNDFKNPGIKMRKLNYVGYGDYFPVSSTLTNNGIRDNSRIQITSYPCTADLGLGKRQLAFHNVGSMNDAPTTKKGGKCGESMDANGCFVDD